MANGVDEVFSSCSGESSVDIKVDVAGPFPNLKAGSKLSDRLFFNGTELNE